LRYSRTVGQVKTNTLNLLDRKKRAIGACQPMVRC
jgi:hypothetical protein